jgi:hypothetical protein
MIDKMPISYKMPIHAHLKIAMKMLSSGMNTRNCGGDAHQGGIPFCTWSETPLGSGRRAIKERIENKGVDFVFLSAWMDTFCAVGRVE